MKRVYFAAVVLVLFVCVAGIEASAFTGRHSLKDIKNALKSDSSEAKNEQLAANILNEGVTFEYTLKRETQIREWGGNEAVISAIWQSIVDDNDEARLYSEFKNNHKSEERDTRISAQQTGKIYLSRFEGINRFKEHAAEIVREVRYLDCEFDPSLGC